MTQATGKLDCWLAVRRPEYYARLQQGVASAALDAFDRQLSVRLPPALRDLYEWRNGQPLDCFEGLEGNWMFMPLEEVAGCKQMLDGMIGEDFDDPRYWRRGWVPFLHNGGGSYLCVDLAAEDGGLPGQVIAFWKADDDRPVEYSSVEGWLNELADALERGVPAG